VSAQQAGGVGPAKERTTGGSYPTLLKASDRLRKPRLIAFSTANWSSGLVRGGRCVRRAPTTPCRDSAGRRTSRPASSAQTRACTWRRSAAPSPSRTGERRLKWSLQGKCDMSTAARQPCPRRHGTRTMQPTSYAAGGRRSGAAPSRRLARGPRRRLAPRAPPKAEQSLKQRTVWEVQRAHQIFVDNDQRHGADHRERQGGERLKLHCEAVPPFSCRVAERLPSAPYSCNGRAVRPRVRELSRATARSTASGTSSI